MKYGYSGALLREDAPIGPGRLMILAIALAVTLALYTGVLFDTQILRHDYYLSLSETSIVRRETVKASRGIVTDRNGNVLISNGHAYDLTFDPSLLKKNQEPNEAIRRLLELCWSQGKGWTDTLPVTWDAPLSYTLDRVSAEQKRRFLNYLVDLRESREALKKYLLAHPDLVDTSDLIPEEPEEPAESVAEPSWWDRLTGFLDSGEEVSDAPAYDSAVLLERLPASALTAALLEDAGITPDTLIEWMARDMALPAEGFSPLQRRQVLGIQYELKQRRLGDNSVYLLTEDIDTVFISLLADGHYAGAKVLNSSVRQYETRSAAHLLGTVGSLYKEDLENPLYDGYPLDATVGKNGVEAAFESYLHGQDGRRIMSVTEDGRVTGEYYSREPQPGNTVELTIDLPFQTAVEEYLMEAVEKINSTDGSDTRGGGVAIVRVGTGEILALASYPTFDITEYRTRYTDLRDDPAQPLLNRATSGTYAPGSTLKPATAVAALSSGKITLTERIRDTGKWVYPRTSLYANCWYKAGHGSQVISQAVTNSCNYFFAELGYRMGMDTLNSYLVQFGLGEHTGIETGDNPGNRPFNPVGEDQAPWAAFGQANQRYTPLQLANYVATLVSGGRHCAAHLLKSVKAYDNSGILAEGNTEPLNEVDIAPEYLNAVRTGMHDLANGSLYRYFQDCVVDVGAKTGTAQLGANITNNSVFVCFAPYDEPEVALAMVIEHGGAGATLAPAAVKMLNAWFDRDAAGGPVTGELELLP